MFAFHKREQIMSGYSLDTLPSQISQLNETIEKFTVSSDKQTKTMIKLTWAILFLTVMLLIGLGVQIVQSM